MARDAGTRLQETKQHLSPPSPGNPSLRSGLAGLVVKGTPKPTKSTTSPMLFYDAPNNAKTATEGDVPRAQMTPASQPRKRRKMRKVMGPRGYYCVYPGCSTLRTTVVRCVGTERSISEAEGFAAVGCHVERIDGLRPYVLEFVAADVAEMIVWTKTSYASYFPSISPHLDLRFYLHLPLRSQPVPPLRSRCCFGFLGGFSPSSCSPYICDQCESYRIAT